MTMKRRPRIGVAAQTASRSMVVSTAESTSAVSSNMRPYARSAVLTSPALAAALARRWWMLAAIAGVSSFAPVSGSVRIKDGDTAAVRVGAKEIEDDAHDRLLAEWCGLGLARRLDRPAGDLSTV